MHVVEYESPQRLGDRRRVRRIGDAVGLVEHLVIPIDGCAGIEHHRQEGADGLHRIPQHRGGGEEGDDVADGYRADHGQCDAGEETECEDHVGYHHEPDLHVGEGTGLEQFRSPELLGLRSEVLESVRAAPEGLEHSDAVHRLLDGGREVTRLVLTQPSDDLVSGVEPEPHDPYRNRRHDEDHPQHPVDRRQDDESAEDGADVDDELHEPEGEETTDETEVAIHAREQLPARPAVVEADRQILEFAVERGAHRGLDARARPDREATPGQDHERLDRAHEEHEERGGDHCGTIAARERPVDELAQHEGDGERHGGPEQLGSGTGDDAPDRLLGEGIEAPERSHRSELWMLRGHSGITATSRRFRITRI